jgi:hypothetical protein
MVSVRDRIGLLTDLFLGAAYADDVLQEKERLYVEALLRDLLSAAALPPALEQRIAGFDRRAFDLRAAAADFLSAPPMSPRRLLELITYVTLADGAQNVDEDAFVRALGEALGLAPELYADLTRDRLYGRNSFIDLARVKLPPQTRA